LQNISRLSASIVENHKTIFRVEVEPSVYFYLDSCYDVTLDKFQKGFGPNNAKVSSQIGCEKRVYNVYRKQIKRCTRPRITSPQIIAAVLDVPLKLMISLDSVKYISAKMR
jgi:hypothetical protein